MYFELWQSKHLPRLKRVVDAVFVLRLVLLLLTCNIFFAHFPLFHVFFFPGLITTTARKLDRENQSEHILEVCIILHIVPYIFIVFAFRQRSVFFSAPLLLLLAKAIRIPFFFSVFTLLLFAISYDSEYVCNVLATVVQINESKRECKKRSLLVNVQCQNKDMKRAQHAEAEEERLLRKPFTNNNNHRALTHTHTHATFSYMTWLVCLSTVYVLMQCAIQCISYVVRITSRILFKLY